MGRVQKWPGGPDFGPGGGCGETGTNFPDFWIRPHFGGPGGPQKPRNFRISGKSRKREKIHCSYAGFFQNTGEDPFFPEKGGFLAPKSLPENRFWPFFAKNPGFWGFLGGSGPPQKWPFFGHFRARPGFSGPGPNFGIFPKYNIL